SAINVLSTGTTLYRDPISWEVQRTFYMACLIGLSGLAVGFSIRRSPRRDARLAARLFSPLDDRSFFLNLVVAAVVAAVVFFKSIRAAFDFTSVVSYYDSALESRLLKRDLGPTQPLDEVFFFQVPVQLLICLSIVLLFRGKNLFQRCLGTMVLLLASWTAVLG